MSAAKVERWTIAGMTLGVALMLQPWWSGGMRSGFFVTAAFSVLQIVLAHVPERRA